MNHMEFREAANYWVNVDKTAVKMPKSELLQAVEDYIKANNTCALATGFGTFIRCTPIEYTFLEGAFYMFSEGGQKFVGLEDNDNVCLAIYDQYEGFTKLKGMQITGKASLIEFDSTEFEKLVAYKNIPLATLRKMSHPMHLIKVVPSRIDFLNGDFKKEGYSSRQVLEY